MQWGESAEEQESLRAKRTSVAGPSAEVCGISIVSCAGAMIIATDSKSKLRARSRTRVEARNFWFNLSALASKFEAISSGVVGSG